MNKLGILPLEVTEHSSTKLHMYYHPSIKNKSLLAKGMTAQNVCLNLRILITSSTRILTQISHKFSCTLCPFMQFYLARGRLYNYNFAEPHLIGKVSYAYAPFSTKSISGSVYTKGRQQE